MASLGPKKDGSPNAEYFNSPESLQGFESVRLWLQKNSKKVAIIQRRLLICCLAHTLLKLIPLSYPALLAVRGH